MYCSIFIYVYCLYIFFNIKIFVIIGLLFKKRYIIFKIYKLIYLLGNVDFLLVS